MRWLLCALVAIAACGDSGPSNPSGGSSGVPNSTSSSGGSSSSGSSSGNTKKDSGAGDDDDDTTKPDSGPPLGPANVRMMAANLTSGNLQSYEAAGIHIFQGLKPDVVMIQEFKVGDNADATIKDFVSTTFGASYTYFREPRQGGIPNGVISRYPILSSGSFPSEAPDRSFAWAKIMVPGTHPLWAFSVHLLTNGAKRDTEAGELVTEIKKMVATDDYVVIGGDFNTDSRGEACLATVGAVVDTTNSHATDGKNAASSENTNMNRNKPYDWVLASPNLVANQVATVIGANSFPNGLVFDSRVYTPLTDVPPVVHGDSEDTAMQHMGIVKDFYLP